MWGPRGRRARLGGWRALVPRGHLGHPPGMILVPKILKYYIKIHIKILLHSEHFHFWAFFYCTDNSENRVIMAFNCI